MAGLPKLPSPANKRFSTLNRAGSLRRLVSSEKRCRFAAETAADRCGCRRRESDRSPVWDPRSGSRGVAIKQGFKQAPLDRVGVLKFVDQAAAQLLLSPLLEPCQHWRTQAGWIDPSSKSPKLSSCLSWRRCQAPCLRACTNSLSNCSMGSKHNCSAAPCRPLLGAWSGSANTR